MIEFFWFWFFMYAISLFFLVWHMLIKTCFGNSRLVDHSYSHSNLVRTEIRQEKYLWGEVATSERLAFQHTTDWKYFHILLNVRV